MYTKFKKFFAVLLAFMALVCFGNASVHAFTLDDVQGLEDKFERNNGQHNGILNFLGLFPNESGWAASYSTLGFIDRSSNNPFFKPFGTNGRTCASCHVQGEGFSMTPKGLQARFKKTKGLDPVFRPNDGSNSPFAPVGTLEERKAAYSVLLNHGLIRVGKPIPTMTNDAVPVPAFFTLETANDPYGFASAAELSLFRRPLPSTNLRFNSSVMWDDRENPRDFLQTTFDVTRCINNPFILPPAFKPCWRDLNSNLKSQANGATLGHAQALQSLTDAEQQAIVDFEMSLVTTQVFDYGAHFLMADGATGGPHALTQQPFYFEINSVFGDPVTGIPASIGKLTAFNMFQPWAVDPGTSNVNVAAKRASIARGEVVFNTRTAKIVGVAGTSTTTVLNVTCTNCHSAPNVGSLGQPNLFALGIGDPNWQINPDLPTYTFKRISTNPALNGQLLTLQDPGQALISGKWGDMGKFKTPGLRGLAMRAPYFHDGSAKTIEDVTAFYIRRFDYTNGGTTPGMTQPEIDDLNNFLKSL